MLAPDSASAAKNRHLASPRWVRFTSARWVIFTSALTTMSRLAGSESVQKFLRDALRIIRAATDISGDVQRTLFWYRNEPLPTFDYKTAEQLVSEGHAEDLLRYVTSLETGAAG
ncbi:hypothetical protein WJ85_10020 [Burkholderia ubonensis]|uniref:DUF2384 domain-containing protein n=1 Tax=Burkholderia ubonensis TaxID=101571 RepID=A0ABD6PVH0_9BURK|nr:DUF2384 domain-containing protein [Burkholderia ubonensis]KVO45923.1 hypothetical protein WJ76_30835 [Burkholderia ubonensis]KVP17554.1 hypothetical protein WJ85_10020 [Burkholderia ubonensis]OJA39835.1 hypothetical protein BGV66_29315 [Burkholderia ubonensis]